MSLAIENIAKGDLMAEIKAVVFDYGNVLCKPPLEDDIQSMAGLLDTNKNLFENAYWQHRLDYDCGLTDKVQYWTAVSGSLGKSVDRKAINDLTRLDVLSWSRPDPEMLTFVENLVNSNVPMAILSNMPRDLKEWVEDDCDWLPEFSHRTYSCDLKCAKPDPKIYSHSKGGFDSHESSLAFVDDRIENVEAAIASGMQAFHFKGLADLLEQLKGSNLVGLN